jgi:hypothetical protein
VSQERDKPQRPTEADLAALRDEQAVGSFIRT